MNTCKLSHIAAPIYSDTLFEYAIIHGVAEAREHDKVEPLHAAGEDDLRREGADLRVAGNYGSGSGAGALNKYKLRLVAV